VKDRRRRLVPLLAAGTSVLALGTMASAVPTSRARPGAGCDVSRPATASYANGHHARVRGRAPVPCAVSIGLKSQESSIAVTRSGAVWVSPAETSTGVVGLAHTSDRGGRWQFTDAAPADSPHTGTPVDNCFCDPALYVDPKTNRIFFFSEDSFYCGGNLNYSDDEGRSWRRTSLFGCPSTQDYDTFVAAPPVTSKTSGYPNILYFCSQGPLVAAGPTRECVKSLDGGKTAATVGSTAGTGLLPAPNLPSCSQYPLSQGHSMAADSRGSIYLPVTFCSDAAVAISRDEGTTWTYVRVGTAGSGLGAISIAADDAGNLFVAWLDSNRRVLLSHSTDHGEHWSKPANVAPAGVYGESKVAVVATAKGRVAVAYYGSRSQKPGGATSGYITESPNALAARSIYWTGAVNNPKHPLCAPYDPSGQWTLCNTTANNFSNRIDYIGVAFGRDGTPWAAFVAECSYVHNCAAQSGASPTVGTDTGVVGSLQLPRS
jgi:BNR repeat-like domain